MCLLIIIGINAWNFAMIAAVSISISMIALALSTRTRLAGVHAFYILYRTQARPSESFASLNTRNSYLNTSGSRLILAFRNSGRRRIYSIVETRDTFEQWRRMLFNRTDVIFAEMSRRKRNILCPGNVVAPVFNEQVDRGDAFFSVEFMMNQRGWFIRF